MAPRVWTWRELPEFYEHFGITENSFAEAIGIRQSTIRNLRTNHTKAPAARIISAVERGMLRYRFCDACGHLVVEKPDAKPASATAKETRKTT